MFPSWQETMVELHRADSVEQLWTVLVTPHGIRSSAMWEEPYGLFRRFHEDDSENAEMTAALLCTDHRWRNGTHLLIDHLTRSGLLSDAALDQMARWFLEDDLLVTAELDVEDDTTTSAGASDGEFFVRRGIRPPLRRWAAARVVGRDPSHWRMVLDRARDLAARDAAAVAAGVMDTAGRIPPAERDEALEVGLGWGSGIVRLAALIALADSLGNDVAIARAADDPSAKVRAWAARAAPQTQIDEDGIDCSEAPAPREAGSAGQDSLF